MRVRACVCVCVTDRYVCVTDRQTGSRSLVPLALGSAPIPQWDRWLILHKCVFRHHVGTGIPRKHIGGDREATEPNCLGERMVSY